MSGTGKDLLAAYILLRLFLRIESNLPARIPLQSKIGSVIRFLPASPRGKRKALRAILSESE